MAPRTLLTAMRPLRSPMIVSTRRAFATTPRMAIKEDADRTPEQVEQAKQEQLREQEQGKGRWREDLASHGESNIAADKQKVHDHDQHMKELQQEGKEKGEKGEMQAVDQSPIMDQLEIWWGGWLARNKVPIVGRRMQHATVISRTPT